MSGGSKIFVGNIPYGTSDEAIMDILGRAGTVLSFRAMTDKDTGKPKGYGFAEYSDPDSAYSAVRNLNDFDLNGRKLRVDYATEKDGGGVSHPAAMATAPTTTAPAAGADAQNAPNRLPALPQGLDLQPGLKAEDAISKTLSTLPVQQLLDILVQMQNLVLNDPVQAQQLLEKSPQLSYAIFQALLNLNLVDPASLSTIIQQSAGGNPAQPPQPQVYQPAAPPQPPQQQSFAPQQQYTQQYTPQPTQPYRAPPPQAPPAAQPAVPDRNALIQQVLSMTQAQIDAMAPADRAQILALRAQLAQQFSQR